MRRRLHRLFGPFCVCCATPQYRLFRSLQPPHSDFPPVSLSPLHTTYIHTYIVRPTPAFATFCMQQHTTVTPSWSERNTFQSNFPFFLSLSGRRQDPERTRFTPLFHNLLGHTVRTRLPPPPKSDCAGQRNSSFILYRNRKISSSRLQSFSHNGRSHLITKPSSRRRLNFNNSSNHLCPPLALQQHRLGIDTGAASARSDEAGLDRRPTQGLYARRRGCQARSSCCHDARL